MQGSEQGCLLPRAACRVAWGQRLCWPDFWLFDLPFVTRQCKCSNYHTVALISLSSKVMLKILQARLQQYVNRELPDVQTGFRKGRGTRDQIANIRWIIKKAREFQKNIYFCFIDYAKPLTSWITINCGKFFKRWAYQTTWPASWETYMQIRKQQLERHGTTDWFLLVWLGSGLHFCGLGAGLNMNTFLFLSLLVWLYLLHWNEWRISVSLCWYMAQSEIKPRFPTLNPLQTVLGFDLIYCYL